MCIKSVFESINSIRHNDLVMKARVKDAHQSEVYFFVGQHMYILQD